MKNMSDEEMLQHLKTLKRLRTFNVKDTSAALVDPMACMKQHEKLKCAVIDNFCACLATYGIKWQAMLKNVPFHQPVSNPVQTLTFNCPAPTASGRPQTNYISTKQSLSASHWAPN